MLQASWMGAWLLCLSVVACNDQGDPEGSFKCFPLPPGAEVRSAGPEEGSEALTTSPGMEDQGTSLQGGAAERAGRRLDALNGAKLVFAADPSFALTLLAGELVAEGYSNTAALRDVPLRAIAQDGSSVSVKITEVSGSIGGVRRVELFVDGVRACEQGQQGVLVGGRWDERAGHVADPELVTYSCRNGAITKCVSWGYAPWKAGVDVHAACTRLARADYCGDGTSWTLDGTSIDAFDRLGIQPAVDNPKLSFEAAWGPSGALCVARPRYEIHSSSTGAPLLPSCFASLPFCESLDKAASLGAVLANQSKVTPIDACE